MTQIERLFACVVTAALLVGASMAAQSNAEPEEFEAIAILNNNLGSGAGVVRMSIDRWSSNAERAAFISTLSQHGPDELLKKLREARPVGTIRTPDSLAYDLRYAYQTKGEDGGRRIVIATDRPIGFWEARNQPRTIDYPFTVIQIQMDGNGKGQGTMSYAARIIARDDVFELENFGTAPVMLTSVSAHPKDR